MSVFAALFCFVPASLPSLRSLFGAVGGKMVASLFSCDSPAFCSVLIWSISFHICREEDRLSDKALSISDLAFDTGALTFASEEVQAAMTCEMETKFYF